MEKALQFLATYNTQIIKGGFAIIFLLLIIYVYRMFFVVTPENSSEGAVVGDAIEQKLNQLLENQKNKASANEGNDPNAGEIDRLKLEVYGLKQQLVEAEKNVGSAPPAAAGAADPAVVGQLNDKIKSLESKLAEYEIIAEDIAELSQLRAENIKLKEQLDAGGGASAPVATAPIVEAVAEPAIEPEVIAAPVVEEPVVADAPISEPVPAASAPSGLNEQSIQDALAQAAADEAIQALNSAKNANGTAVPISAQDATDNLLASVAAEEAAKSAVSEQDRKLLEEFEQTVVKKG